MSEQKTIIINHNLDDKEANEIQKILTKIINSTSFLLLTSRVFDSKEYKEERIESDLFIKKRFRYADIEIAREQHKGLLDDKVAEDKSKELESKYQGVHASPVKLTKVKDVDLPLDKLNHVKINEINKI